jgi:hypothetical protein
MIELLPLFFLNKKEKEQMVVYSRKERGPKGPVLLKRKLVI